MGVVSPSAPDRSFEEFYSAHVEEFRSYLTTVIGPDAELKGGRLGVEDALQAGVLRIYGKWPGLRDAREEERDQRAYRCLRDAAGEALRSEQGRRDQGAVRPWVGSYDFDMLDADEDELPPREREMTSSVLGAMARQVAAGSPEERAMLDRAVLLAGLRALTEREAVVLIAVDHVGWEQTALAHRLGVKPGTVYEALFGARKLFYTLVRHAVGIEVDDEERARLYAYEDGALKGKEKRIARRHLNHCRSCQALMRERRAFGQRTHRVLSGLPFLAGADVLVKKTAVKAAATVPTSSAAAAGKGLFAQAGAAKALGSTAAILTLGVGAGAWLSIAHAPHATMPPPPAAIASLHVRSPAAPLPSPVSATKRAPSKPHRKTASSHRHTKKRKSTAPSTSSPSSAAPSTTTPPASSTPPASVTPTAPSTSGGSGSSGGGGSSSGGSSGGGGGQTEFFDG